MMSRQLCTSAVYGAAAIIGTTLSLYIAVPLTRRFTQEKVIESLPSFVALLILGLGVSWCTFVSFCFLRRYLPPTVAGTDPGVPPGVETRAHVGDFRSRRVKGLVTCFDADEGTEWQFLRINRKWHVRQCIGQSKEPD
jgi:hypothetical protein